MTPLETIKSCIHRGPEQDGLYPCSSPFVLSRGGKVTGEACLVCRYANLTCADKPSHPSCAKRGQDPSVLPGLIQQGINFAGSLIRHLRNGSPLSSEEEKARRISICNGCERLTKQRKCGTTTGCGCPVDVKASWLLEECPHDKW